MYVSHFSLYRRRGKFVDRARFIVWIAACPRRPGGNLSKTGPQTFLEICKHMCTLFSLTVHSYKTLNIISNFNILPSYTGTLQDG